MSQNIPDWLLKYYGSEFNKYNPSIVFDGKNKAVVRILQKSTNVAHSSIGFVLIKKNGQQGISDWKSLYEGVPNQAAMDKMQAVLTQEDDLP